MRVLVMHSSDNKVLAYAEALKQALEQAGHKADLVSASQGGSGPVSSAQYGLVCLISGFSGFFRPKIGSEIDGLLKRCTRLEGKKGAAFVPGKLGSTKALRALMALMERQGVIVEDFSTIRSANDVKEVAKRLARLDRPGS